MPPVSRNAQLLKEWRSTLDKELIKSPCTPIPIPTETLIERILRTLKSHASKDVDKRAVIDGFNHDRWLTHQQIYDRALSFASFLISRGVKPGDRVAIAMPNAIEWSVLYLGTWAADATVVCAAFELSESSYQWRDCETSVIVTNELLLDSVVQTARECSSVKTIVCVRSSDKPLPEGIVDYAEAIKNQPLERISEASLDDVCIIAYTTGTTGEPKGVLHTHRTLHCQVETVVSHYLHEVYGVLDEGREHEYKESFILTTSCQHIMAFLTLNWALINGYETVLMPSFDGPSYVEAVEKFKPRCITITPHIFAYFAKEAPPTALASVRMVLCAAAPLRGQLCEAFLTRHQAVKYIAQGYGSTEIGASHLPFLYHEGVNAYVGMLTAMVEQKIIDPVSLQPVGRGQWGEVCMRGPTLMIGYLNKPEATSATIDEEGWYHTGDVGYVDDQGFLFVLDRVKELISVNFMGEQKKVSPAEIEGLLVSSSRIRDAAVIGIPQANGKGELIRAFVVKGQANLTEMDVEELVANNLPDYKHITGGVFFIDVIPRISVIAKIQRHKLRELSQA